MIGPLKAVIASAALLAIWAGLGAIAFGLGRMVRWALRPSSRSAEDAGLTCWLGFAFACTVLLGWSFLKPIDGLASAVLVVAGLSACYRARWALIAACRSTGAALGATGLIVSVVFGLWLANHARGALTYWDSGNYHIQAVRWAATFPVVPGLANLHSRFGLQSAGFLYYAAIATGPFRQHAHHIANGFLLLLLGVGALASIFGHSRGGGRRLLPTTVHAGGLAVAVAWIALEEAVPSFATDIPATAVGFVMASAFVALFRKYDGEDSDRTCRVIAVVYLAATSVALKLSLAPAAAGVTLICGWMLWTRPAPVRVRLRGFALGAAFVLLPVGLTLARGVATSGYPLYPASVLPFPVDWRVPADQPLAERVFIRADSRRIANEIGINPKADKFANWLPRWVDLQWRVPFNIFVPAAIIVGGVLGLLALRGRGLGGPLPPALPLAPFVLGVLVWWQTAPLPRYAVVPCWTLAAWVATALLQRLPTAKVRWFLGAPAALALLFAPALNATRPDARMLLRSTAWGLVGHIREDHWVDGFVAQPRLETYVTGSGARLNFASGRDGRCWDAPLPCTPTPARNLELRDPSQLARGFRVRGAWQPDNWPEPWLPHLRAGVHAPR